MADYLTSGDIIAAEETGVNQGNGSDGYLEPEPVPEPEPEPFPLCMSVLCVCSRPLLFK